MLGILINSLKTGVITEAEPLGMPASFGFPVIDFSRCTACDECARACPTGAIQTTTAGADKKIVTLSYAACIQCRACVTECPDQAVSVSHAVEVAAYTRQQLARSASFDIDRATGRGTLRASGSAPGPHPSGISGSTARADPRSTRALASCAPGGRGKLQRVRDGDCGDDEPNL